MNSKDTEKPVCKVCGVEARVHFCDPCHKRSEYANNELIRFQTENLHRYALNLLRAWIKCEAAGCKPGAWEYDKEKSQLVEDSAKLVGIDDPWKEC
jgi:hypothetical protein